MIAIEHRLNIEREQLPPVGVSKNRTHTLAHGNLLVLQLLVCSGIV